MDTLAERLTWARKQKGWNQSQLAKEAGVTQSAIGNLEAGIRRTSRSIAALAAALEVDALWLEQGKGVPELAQKAARSLHLVNNVREIDDDEEPDGLARIRKVEIRLSAGISGFTVDPAPNDGAGIWFRKDWLQARGYKAGNLIATGVKGPSMEPGLFEGDTIIFNTADTTPKDGAIFAVNYEGECVIKRLIRDAGTWWLSSDNPDQRRFPRKECVGDSCIILGRVVHKQSEVL